MRRILCGLLAVVIAVFTAIPLCASAEGEMKYGCIACKFQGEPGVESYIDVCTDGENVFVDAVQLGEYLDCGVELEGNGVVFSSSVAEGEKTIFSYGSTSVSKTIAGIIHDGFEAPYAPFEDDNGSWVPLAYTATLLKSDIEVFEGTAYFVRPEKNLSDLMFDVQKNFHTFNNSWASVYDLDKTAFKAMGYSSFTVNRLNNIISGNVWGDWIKALSNGHLLTKDGFNYGEKYATLYCTVSKDELQEQINRGQFYADLIKKDERLGKIMQTIDLKLDKDVGLYKEQLEKLIDAVKGGDKQATAMYNRIDYRLDMALKNQDLFNATGGRIIDIQSGFEKAGKVGEALNGLAYACDFAYYASEFWNQDAFSTEALKSFTNSGKINRLVSDDMTTGLRDQLDALSGNGLSYSAFNTLFDFIGQEGIHEGLISEMIGLPANIVLVAWDIMSNSFPFYKDGLSATDDFELSLFATAMQSAAFDSFLSKKDKVLNQETITPEQMYELCKECYNYLKASYVLNTSMSGALKNVENAQGAIDTQTLVCSDIAYYLVPLKNATDSNDDLKYGLLPGDGYSGDPAVDQTLTGIIQEGKKASEMGVSLSKIIGDSSKNFVFSSGVGAWRTLLALDADGSFEGEYTDSDYDGDKDEYITYISTFTGKFGEISKIDDYTYKLSSIEYKTVDTKEEWTENGVKYIATEPFGIEDVDSFYLYMPGKKTSEMPEEAASEYNIHSAKFIRKTVLSVCTLYNDEQEVMFIEDTMEEGSYPGDSRDLVDYIGLPIGELETMWGNDYQMQFVEGGSGIKYYDGRIPGIFVPWVTDEHDGEIYDSDPIYWILIHEPTDSIQLTNGLNSAMTLKELEKSGYPCEYFEESFDDVEDGFCSDFSNYAIVTVNDENSVVVTYYWWYDFADGTVPDPYSTTADYVEIESKNAPGL